MAFDMAKFAAEDTNFVAVSAEAASTHPVQCGTLKKGGLVVLKVTSNVIARVYVCVCVHVCIALHVHKSYPNVWVSFIDHILKMLSMLMFQILWISSLT